MSTILHADDSDVSRELVRECLEGLGYEVIEAVNGQEVLEHLCVSRPALVLLDIRMPVMDGYETVRAIRAQPQFSNLPVIAITAFAMRGDLETAIAAGFDAYITKPIQIRTLREAIGKLLSGGIHGGGGTSIK